MPSPELIVLEYVCPALGTLLCNLMFAAPFKDLSKALKENDLGDLNPTPWAFMLGNSFGWLVYGVLQQNLWYFFSNAPGFVLSVWLNLGAAKLLHQGHHSTQMRKSVVAYLQHREKSTTDTRTVESSDDDEEEGTQDTVVTHHHHNVAATAKDWAHTMWEVTSQTTPAPTPHEDLVVGIVVIWMCCVSVIAYVNVLSADTKLFIVGCLANLNMVFFHVAPLSRIVRILKERNSALIHIPSMIASTLNGVLWTAYGIAINDYWIYVPCGLTAAMGGLQMLLCLIFPRKPRSKLGDMEPNADNKEANDLDKASTDMTTYADGVEPLSSSLMEEGKALPRTEVTAGDTGVYKVFAKKVADNLKTGQNKVGRPCQTTVMEQQPPTRIGMDGALQSSILRTPDPSPHSTPRRSWKPIVVTQKLDHAALQPA